MTTQIKAVFANPQILRKKLGEYLNTNDTSKIEKYAIVAEKMFDKGQKQSLKFYIGWSWWAFFGQFWYCLYRGANKAGLKYAIFGLVPLIMCIPLCYLVALFGGGSTDSNDTLTNMIAFELFIGEKIAWAFLLIAVLFTAISQWACIFHSKCHIIKGFEKALDENVPLFGVGHKRWVVPVGIIYGILYPILIFSILGASVKFKEIGAKQYMDNALTESKIAWEKLQMEAKARNKLAETEQVFKKEYEARNTMDLSTEQTSNSDLEISQKERIIAEVYNPYMNGDLDNPGVLPGGVFEKYSTNRLKRVLMGALKSYEVSESGDGGCLYDEIDPLTIAYAASSEAEFRRSFKIVADTLTPMAKFKVNGVDVSVYFSFECANGKCLIDDVTINAPAGELFEEGLYAPSLSKYIENCLRANNIAY